MEECQNHDTTSTPTKIPFPIPASLQDKVSEFENLRLWRRYGFTGTETHGSLDLLLHWRFAVCGLVSGLLALSEIRENSSDREHRVNVELGIEAIAESIDRAVYEDFDRILDFVRDFLPHDPVIRAMVNGAPQEPETQPEAPNPDEPVRQKPKKSGAAMQ